MKLAWEKRLLHHIIFEKFQSRMAEAEDQDEWVQMLEEVFPALQVQ
jgi:hypothetical protein